MLTPLSSSAVPASSAGGPTVGSGAGGVGGDHDQLGAHGRDDDDVGGVGGLGAAGREGQVACDQKDERDQQKKEFFHGASFHVKGTCILIIAHFSREEPIKFAKRSFIMKKAAHGRTAV